MHIISHSHDDDDDDEIALKCLHRSPSFSRGGDATTTLAVLAVCFESSRARVDTTSVDVAANYRL